MIRLLLLILLISANCMKMNCEEETSESGIASEELEKTELLSTEQESLQIKVENSEAEKDASKAADDIEEVRVSRSSSNLSASNVTQLDDTFKVDSTEVILTEKSAPNELVGEVDSQIDKEVKELQSQIKSAEALEEDTKPAENVEKQVEELGETSRSAPENEDRKAEDLLEASAENKVSDNEKASSKVDEGDRNTEIQEIKEKSDESGFDESLETRRMFTGSDFIVINSKTRPNTTAAVKPEVKIAFDQNLNTYNNFDVFGTDSNIKLTESSRTEPTPVAVKTTMPITTKVATQEIFNQQYFPKFYPRPELNINFPNVNSAFQGPRDLPIYLKVKQDELHSNNQYIVEQNSRFKSSEDNKYSNLRNQQNHNSQSIFNTPRTLTNKEFEDLRVESRVQMPRLYQNQGPTDFESFIGNKQIANLKQDSRIPDQQFYHNQEKLNSGYNRLGNINQEAKNKMPEIVNSKMPMNNVQANQYPLFRQPQGTLDSKINLENKQPGTDRLTNSYSYEQLPNPQTFNVMNTPITIIPKNIRVLFEKLASASEYPRKLQTNMYNKNNIGNYPHFINPNYGSNSFPYDQTLPYGHFPGFYFPT